MIPSPQALGLPAKFDHWRPGQEDAVLEIDKLMNSPRPVGGLVLPTGAGKSVIYVAWALWRKKRVLILTANRALQTQIHDDFFVVGMRDVRGQANYPCIITEGTVDTAPCHGGYDCMYKSQGCEYFDLMRALKKGSAEIWSGNYAFHLANRSDFPDFDLIVCDEAHSAVDELARHQTVTFTRPQIEKYFSRHPIQECGVWAKDEVRKLKGKLEDLKAKKPPHSDAHYLEVAVVQRFIDKTTILATADPHTFTYRKDHSSWHWECVWPAQAKHLLFKRAKKFLLTSATMSRKTMSMLGLGNDEFYYKEYDSTFPVENRPIYYFTEVVAPSLTWQSAEPDYRKWLALVDLIAAARPTRGIIHTGSYDRCEKILLGSKHAHRMITHARSGELATALAQYRATPGAILLSPSLSAGANFPGRECWWQIIAKMPFSNPTDPVNVERKKTDPLWGIYATTLDLEQMSGRNVRSPIDFGETFIIDGTFDAWFRVKSEPFMHTWFRAALRRITKMPKLQNKDAKIVD